MRVLIFCETFLTSNNCVYTYGFMWTLFSRVHSGAFLHSCTSKIRWYVQLTPKELYVKIQSQIAAQKNEDKIVMCSCLLCCTCFRRNLICFESLGIASRRKRIISLLSETLSLCKKLLRNRRLLPTQLPDSRTKSLLLRQRQRTKPSIAQWRSPNFDKLEPFQQHVPPYSSIGRFREFRKVKPGSCWFPVRSKATMPRSEISLLTGSRAHGHTGTRAHQESTGTRRAHRQSTGTRAPGQDR